MDRGGVAVVPMVDATKSAGRKTRAISFMRMCGLSSSLARLSWNRSKIARVSSVVTFLKWTRAISATLRFLRFCSCSFEGRSVLGGGGFGGAAWFWGLARCRFGVTLGFVVLFNN